MPSPLLSAATHKGYPAWAATLPLADVGRQGWHVLQPDWPLPCAVLRQSALRHNLGWMQRLVHQAGVDLAPHGKTTLSPELFQAQLDAGAWGITFASVAQLAMGVTHGVRRAVIANQVLLPHDLAWLARLLREHSGLQAPFLLDSDAQLQAIENAALDRPLDVLLELGLPAGRTGCRSHEQALALASAAHASSAVRLVGLECYEGMATGDTAADTDMVQTLMQRMHSVARACDDEGLFDGAGEIIITAGGSSVFDLVAPLLKPELSRPVRALMRSGCYLTHDDGLYQRLVKQVDHRLATDGLAGQPWGCGSGLQSALEVWAVVQSRPEPHIAILNAGKRDLSHDMGLPTPRRWCPLGRDTAQPLPGHWRTVALNDQHTHLHLEPTDAKHPDLRVGDRVALGISHPCTTFDKWRWMPVTDDSGQIVDAISTIF